MRKSSTYSIDCRSESSRARFSSHGNLGQEPAFAKATSGGKLKIETSCTPRSGQGIRCNSGPGALPGYGALDVKGGNGLDRRETRIAALKNLLKERIVILDGAMGTMIQAQRLEEEA